MNHVIASTLALLASTSVVAQPDAVAIAAKVGAACPAMIAGLLDEGSLAKAMKQRPVSTAAVCSCTTKRLEADEKFSAYLRSPDRDYQAEGRNEALQSYLALLAATSVYACLLPELEASKNAIELTR